MKLNILTTAIAALATTAVAMPHPDHAAGARNVETSCRTCDIDFRTCTQGGKPALVRSCLCEIAKDKDCKKKCGFTCS